MECENQHHIRVENWAQNFAVYPKNFYEPTSVDQVKQIVSSTNSLQIRVIGSKHSPSDICMTNDTIISLRKMNRVLNIDVETKQVRVEAGLTLEDLNEILSQNGLALQNLGSISEQSVAGAISTGTHGTGVGEFVLSATILEIKVVSGTGEVLKASATENSSLYYSTICGLGCMGVIVETLIQATDAFDLYATQAPTTLEIALQTYKEKIKLHQFYRFWYIPHTNIVTEWYAKKVPPHAHRLQPPKFLRMLIWLLNWIRFSLFGFHLYRFVMFLSIYLPSLIVPINYIWGTLLFNLEKRISVDRSDRLFNIDCLFQQHVNEWSIPIDDLPLAMVEINEMINRIGHYAHFPIEVRFTAADKVWLSPSYGRVSAWIGIIAYKPFNKDVPYKVYFSEFEKIMNRYNGRPHWAKIFDIAGDKDFKMKYDRWHEFKYTREKYDPDGKFVNAWSAKILGLAPVVRDS
jgi:L-gulonolactone oxidase